jgi:hypothetical protein
MSRAAAAVVMESLLFWHAMPGLSQLPVRFD